MKLQIPSVNYHLWEPCNMSCHFCFATFQDVKNTVLPKGHLSKEKSLEVVRVLAQLGFSKITFAGGEPLLCPWIAELVILAKELGLTTMIVTNGGMMDEKRISSFKGSLDWITLSVDSINPHVNDITGRRERKRILTADDYLQIVDSCRKAGIRIKVNTVVTAFNHQEDLSDFILKACPERWKVLQVLPIDGQNDPKIDEFLITSDQFDQYVQRHQRLSDEGIAVVPESNEAMTDSYMMVDPAGRFFSNQQGTYQYSAPILDTGVANALNEIQVSEQNFLDRGGLYDWG